MASKTLHDAAQEYLEHLKGQGKTERTIYTYQMDLKQVEAFFKPDRKLTAILVPHVGSFLKSDALLKMRGDKERSDITVRKTVRVFRMFLEWAKEQGYIEKLPFPKHVLSKVEGDAPMGRKPKTTSEVTDADDPPAAE